MGDRRNLQHAAHYDSDGNIVIPAGAKQSSKDPKTHLGVSRVHRNTHHLMTHVGKTTMPPLPVQRTPTVITGTTRSLLTEVLEESKNQMQETKKGMKEVCSALFEHVRTLLAAIVGFIVKLPALLLSPLTPPTFFRTRSRRPRWQLFIFDSVRFGGTFAAIFTALFVAVNYQSFWEIARAQLAIGRDISRESSLTRLSQGKSAVMSFSGTFVAQSERTLGLHRTLPKVGPIEDRLIIPKLNANVPVVRPKIDALLEENWQKFEEDIQGALREGVVHYPGSARPGQPGNFFVTGHSSYYPWDAGKYKDVFARLGELDIGDTYSVYYGGDLFVYRIINKREVKPTDVSVLDQPTKQRLASLMTCTPIGTTLRRLILTAEEIDPVTGRPLAVGSQRKSTNDQDLPEISVLPI